MVSPCSDRISRVPPYSRTIVISTRTGLSPTTAALSRAFHFNHNCHWPGPRSLATTCGVSVDVLSCRYLDVSVPCVRFLHPILFRCRYLITIPRNLFCPHGRRPADGAPDDRRRALRYEGSPSQPKQQNRFSRYLRWVAPFGDPWIKAHSQLPTAFRSVSRPSSPVHAKASTKCPYDT